MQDTRTCGTGACLIDPSGRCWCGQHWDGNTMCRPGETTAPIEPQPEPESDISRTTPGEVGY